MSKENTDNMLKSERDQRASALVSRMTLEEKISQLVYEAPAIERLGIPQYNWWNECLHGLGRAGKATVFPQSIGLASTWNPQLMVEIATAISDEARAKHHEAQRRNIRRIYSGLTFWSPNVNIFRDPRWGRGQETYGEDPYLSAQMGVAFIRGLQGDDPRFLKTVATPKHFAVHSGPEPKRHHFDAQVEDWELRDFYLFAFEACIREAKAASIMGAYNRVNGEPACSSPTLLEQILRQEWGFDGYVVSDCEAIRDIYKNHKVTVCAAEAAAQAVTNGCDLNCGTVYEALADAMDQELISEEEIDQAVRRLFVARLRLGMFEPEVDVSYTKIPYTAVDSPEHRRLALQAARESIVLLKNDGDLLPLPKDLHSIAVVGPNADDLQVLLGNYNGTPRRAITPLQGIRNKLSPGTNLLHAQGCEIASDVVRLATITSDYLRPVEAERDANGLTADYYDNQRHEGEPALRRVDSEIDFTWLDTTPLTDRWGDTFSVTWDGFLVPPIGGIYRLGVNGFNEFHLQLDGKTVAEANLVHHPVLMTSDVYLEAGRSYRLRLDYSSRGLDPQIQLLWSPLDVDLEPAALQAAQNADVVIAIMGLSPSLEGEEMPLNIEGFSGGDRTDIYLPETQENLLIKIAALDKPVVLILLNGSALAVNWADEHIPAILEAWYPGQAGGEAIADVLFGEYNPGGKLPVTFHTSIDDMPSFDDYHLAGRTYRYFEGETLYPFGHGLSYSDFSLQNLQLSHMEVSVGGVVSISLDIENVGDVAGEEVVQLYVRQPDSSIHRPRKALMGFRRVHLTPGKRKTITFRLAANQLGLYDRESTYLLQAGNYQVFVGTSSEDLPLETSIRVKRRSSYGGQDKEFFSECSVGPDTS